MRSSNENKSSDLRSTGINEIAFNTWTNKDRPSITFTLNSQFFDEDGYPIDHPLFCLGTFVPKDLSIVITSARKGLIAIRLFLALVDTKTKVGRNGLKDEFLKGLERYKKACEDILQAKQKKQLAEKSENISQFEETRSNPSVSMSPTFFAQKNGKTYVIKKCVNGRSITEIEAFNGFCYRLLLGKQHPKVSSLHDKNGDRVGLASEEIPHFISIYDYYDRERCLSAEIILTSKMIKVLVAAYVEEESDMHVGNFGFDLDGCCIKIDDDRSTWPLTSKYAGYDTEKKYDGYETSAALSFGVDRDDIISFPRLQHAHPRSWPNVDSERGIFRNLASIMNEKEFVYDKYYTFLKRILIPNEVYQAIGDATLSSPTLRKKFVDHKCAKTKTLRKVLMSSHEFKVFIFNNPDIIKKITAEFAQYNDDYYKKHDAYLKVNLKRIEHNFQQLASEINIEIERETKITIKDEIKNETPVFWKRYPILRGALIGLGIFLIAGLIITAICLSGGTAAIPLLAAGAVLMKASAVILPIICAAGATLCAGVSAWIMNRIGKNNIHDNEKIKAVDEGQWRLPLHRSPVSRAQEEFSSRQDYEISNSKSNKY